MRRSVLAALLAKVALGDFAKDFTLRGRSVSEESLVLIVNVPTVSAATSLSASSGGTRVSPGTARCMPGEVLADVKVTNADRGLLRTMTLQKKRV